MPSPTQNIGRCAECLRLREAHLQAASQARHLEALLHPDREDIRYYGFLANCHRVDKLDFCRRCLAVPGSDLLPPPMAYREFREFYFHLTGRNLKRCPQCGIGTMIQIEILFSCHGPIPIRLDTS